jgi:uncharacterized protein
MLQNMITPLYASIMAALMCLLALNVIRARRKNKVRYGDGNVLELQIARTAHSNAVDYVPISLILLILLELNHGNIYLIHLTGVLLLAGRFTYSIGILREWMKGRVVGMHLTIWTILLLALLNLIYLPYETIF